ncbi:CBS domain-containing protein [Cohnella endophytica]|uniref:CBS domain-containing protein n=1 Tax=Cohnella endophytica TaxID=2419778 RepID=A0A494Y5K2_9BACL|nr:CBS domain-containing protein [Cohnella endophytica]RKP55596.1 CBS domain-containing protein [Cohnella endophytica]
MTMVSEVMTKNVKFCKPHDSVTTAAKIMREINCGSVPVCEGNKVIGMITDRDIVINCVADGKDCNSVHCHDCMTTNVITCSPEMDVHECARLMAEHQIRRIPVVRNGEMIGICAIGDLARINIYANEAGEALSQISEQHTH